MRMVMQKWSDWSNWMDRHVLPGRGARARLRDITHSVSDQKDYNAVSNMLSTFKSTKTDEKKSLVFHHDSMERMIFELCCAIIIIIDAILLPYQFAFEELPNQIELTII